MTLVQPKGPFKINRDVLHFVSESAVLVAARAYVEADVAVHAKDNFARVGVGTGEGGYSLILKKVP